MTFIWTFHSLIVSDFFRLVAAPLSLLSSSSWDPSCFQIKKAVQPLKLDEEETVRAGRPDEGPAFVLRHRNSNLTENATNCSPAGPMSPQEKNTPNTSGSSTSHLSTAECPSHHGVSTGHTHLPAVSSFGALFRGMWHGGALLGHTVKQNQNSHPNVNNVKGVIKKLRAWSWSVWLFENKIIHHCLFSFK